MTLRKTICLLALALLCVAPAFSADESADQLHFLDGSVLRGRLESITPGRGIRWQHPDAAAPIEITPTNLDRIAFGTSRSMARETNFSSQFQLRNGDEFTGDLARIADDKLTMHTWFGKELTVPRSAVAEMKFQTDSVLYEGPDGIGGWKTGAGMQPWEYRDGAFTTRSNAVVGRDVSLPDTASIQFDLSWTGQYSLYVMFYAEIFDRLDYTQNTYVLQMFSGHATLTRVHRDARGANITSLGQSLPLPVRRTGRKKTTLELRVSRPEAQIELFCDGQLVHRWRDDRGFSGKGSAIGFYAQPQNSTLAISNIRVIERRTSSLVENIAPGRSDADFIQLINRDRVSGVLHRFDGNEVEIASADLKLKIPASRIAAIRFRDSRTNPPALRTWDAQVGLAGGGAITMALQRWDAQQIQGESSMFGPLTFPSSAVRELVFNRDKPRDADKPDAGDDDWNLDSPQPQTAVNRGKISLQNGDSLGGSVQSISGKIVRWNRADAVQPFEWRRDAVNRIEFTDTAFSVPNDAPPAHVELWNGDQLEGALASADREALSLETVALGTVRLPREAIRSVRLERKKRALVFAGPTGLDGWTMGKVSAVADAGEWSYNRGAFFAARAASIARDVKLPAIASIKFDLAWKGQLQEAFALYTDYLQPINLASKDTEPDFGGFYSLQINSLTATLVVVEKNKPLRTLEAVPLPGLNEKNRAHFEIRVNKPARIVALLVDGKTVKEWTDTEFVGSGTGVRFVHQGLGDVRLSRLVIADWDGFTEKPEETVARTVDLLTPRSGDAISGRLEAIRDGTVSFQGNAQKFELPLEDIRRFEFAHRDISAAEKFDITVLLANGQRLRMSLDRWADNEVSGTNPLLGKIKLRASAIERVEFQKSAAQ